MRGRILTALATACFAATLMAQSSRPLNLRGDRFKPLAADALTPQQQTLVNDLLAGSRTSLDGPFNAYLRSPDMGNIAQKLGEYVRFRTSLPRKLNEMTIILTAKHWSSQYEWYAHAPLAVAAGLAQSVVDDIRAGRRPAAMKPDEAVVYDFCSEMRDTHRVSDATFKAAVTLVGEQGVMDVIAAMGYYDLVSMTLNADRYPLPANAIPPFPEPVAPK
jgi:4-carboxymuconolactone decarboxylase